MTAVASPVDVAVNPNNTAQRYILWSNGRIDAIGGAVPITDQATWYDRFEPPGVALHITDWTAGKGYTLDYRGGFNPFGGAPALGASSTPTVVAGIPTTASPSVRLYVDWSWDPSGSGQGYVLDLYGQLYPFGGAVAPPRTGRRFSSPMAKRLVMRWSPDVRAITMDMFGGLYADFAGTVDAYSQMGRAIFDAARDLVVLDWTTTPASGQLLDLYGGLHKFGAAAGAYGWPYNQGGDLARCLAAISTADPAEFLEVWAGGQQYDFVSSTPPSVTAGGSSPASPAATVTDTTRPDLLWDYSDPQNDSQADVQVLVFTQAFAGSHDMTDPLQWTASALVARETIDRTARGIACPVDLPNDSYRLFVRAEDTSGQWSPWSTHDWTQNVPAPATPTGLTAVADEASFTVALSVSATTGGSANLIRFEASDDGGVTWASVVGASSVLLAATTTATDRFLPLGVDRLYRAIAYATDPAVASAPSNTAQATLTKLAHALTAVNDATLGGQVKVSAPVQWSRTAVASVFGGLGAEYPTVVSDGPPKARRATLPLTSLDAAAWALINGLAESDSVLVYRDPFGAVVYCKLVGDWQWQQIKAAATYAESTPLRHMHDVGLPLVEVAPPTAA